MNHPTPAIVAQGAVRRLPRAALLLFCAAYVIPGFFGRGPWKGADMATFGYMLEMARGATNWMDPQLLGLRPEADGLLPYWLGAGALQLAPAWLAPELAARFPFVFMLTMSLVATWYAVYQLARSPQAQPVAFAFGGEANPSDYARAIGDGGLLALIACLGLAQLSHQITTHLTQLCFAALSFYGAAAIGYRMLVPTAALALGLSGLVLSAAPSLAIAFGAGAALLHLLTADRSGTGRRRALRAAALLALVSLLAAALASALNLWRWRIALPQDALGDNFESLAKLLLWFTWPAWPLVIWTLWRWRHQVFNRDLSLHIALPLWFAGVTIFATLTTRPADRALLLALPALATLAAFALPTLQRSVAALIDWFTLAFFTCSGIVIWVFWYAMQTGYPHQLAVNVLKQAPDFQASFSLPIFLIALLASLVWAWLVKWRIGRHQATIWKSLILPAGGAALCWLLLMTLWMPLLDYVRGYKEPVANITSAMDGSRCLQAMALSRDQIAALQYHGGLALEPVTEQSLCPWLLADPQLRQRVETIEDSGVARWKLQAVIRRSSGKADEAVLFRRRAP